jgi:DNA ligase (NAD+)
VLEQVNDQLFCRSPDCGVKLQKAVEHFAKTLKIKGLGPASIEKLGLANIVDIYSLTEEDVFPVLGEKVGAKLLEEIEKSKTATLEQLLPAFSIPLFGTTAAQKLCSVITNITELSEEVCKKAGLGPKVTSNLLTWYENDFVTLKQALDFSFTSGLKAPQSTKGVVCITGKLKSYKTKEEAKSVLEELGYIVKDSLTKDVTILVNESGVESSKTKKARESGVTIVNKIDEVFYVSTP